MKKTVSILLLAVLCLGLCACENGRGGSEDLDAAVWEKAYYLDAFNDPTEEYYIGTAQRLRGSYSSDSVTDGKLEAEIRVDTQMIAFYLYENGSDLVKNGDKSYIEFSVLMKAADGSKTQLYGAMASGGDCVLIREEQLWSVLHFEDREPQETPVATALCAEDGEVSFYLTREDQPATSYLFTVKTGNFASLYETEIATPIREAAYARAESLLAENDYDRAISLFTALGDYRDSAAHMTEATNAARYAQAESLLAARDYDGAIAAFTALGDYRDSAARAEEARTEQYAFAEDLLEARDYSGAVVTNGVVTITKHPIGVTVNAGDSATFIAHAANATSVTWRLVSPDSNTVYDANNAASFDGLQVGGANSDILLLVNIPTSLNNWYAEAMFSGQGGPVYTNGARITVGGGTGSGNGGTGTGTGTGTIGTPTRTALTITGQSAGLTLESGMRGTLFVHVKADSDTVHYQWYRVDTNTNQGGTAIAGATASSYTPEELTGTTYYYVQVWTGATPTEENTLNSRTASVTYTTPTTIEAH